MIVDCPFSECSARVELILEQATVGDDESTTWRVPEHELAPQPPGYGSCPASLMGHPLQPYERNVLGHEQRKVAVRRVNDHLRDVVREPSEERPEHQKTPHPDPNPGPWFRNGDDPPPAEGPPRAPRRPLGRLPIKEENREQGAAVASVAEARAAIDQANQLMAEAMAANQVVDGKLAEALALITWVRGSTVDPLAAPHLASASESCGNVHKSLNLGIEANNVYALTL